MRKDESEQDGLQSKQVPVLDFSFMAGRAIGTRLSKNANIDRYAVSEKRGVAHVCRFCGLGGIRQTITGIVHNPV